MPIAAVYGMPIDDYINGVKNEATMDVVISLHVKPPMAAYGPNIRETLGAWASVSDA